ncbi:MAG: hypothetical protein E6J90_44190 [Deltaproteobacteria bacterium]|nr:MAG: hypothetical protein E6J91_43290 [Deltaproteobacteria bacterium]TMQ07194.1 MAG: hypothetical protein E6J90_44190 [Deltaproteobacteria bacterium]
MTHFQVLSNSELAPVFGGQRIAPSTGINLGVKAMELLDHPQKTLDSVKGFLGIPDSGRPGDVYTPATMNSDGSINQGRFDAPRTPGMPEVPMSQ